MLLFHLKEEILFNILKLLSISIDFQFQRMIRLNRWQDSRFSYCLEDNTWSTQYTMAKHSQYSNSPTEWTLLNLDLTQESFGIKLVLDEIETAHSHMCFSNITKTHSVF